MTTVASRYRQALLGALLPIVTACGAAPDESVDELTQANHQFCGNYWWRAARDGQKVRLGSVDTDFCWLTMAAGRFDGTKGQSGVDVIGRANDRSWWLETHGAEEQGEAHCIPLNCFVGDGVNDTRFTSWNLNFSAFANRSTSSCDDDARPAWKGDAATVLQSWPHSGGPAGRTDGGGEAAWINQATSAFANSQIAANDCAWEGGLGNPIFPSATSLFVGTPGGSNVPTFFNVGAGSQQGFQATLASANDAICYFTKIMGEFRGGGEAAHLFRRTEGGIPRWILATRKGGASDFVRAEARCFPFHQPNL